MDMNSCIDVRIQRNTMSTKVTCIFLKILYLKADWREKISNRLDISNAGLRTGLLNYC